MYTDRKYTGSFGNLFKSLMSKKQSNDHLKRYVRQLENAFTHMVEVANAVSLRRETFSAGHDRQVSNIAVAIGKEMGFNEHRLEGLRISGRLHDIGNIAIPVDILSGTRKLTQSEYTLVMEHPLTGYELLKEVEFPWPVATVVMQHHERMNGSGYPYGLKGEEILLESRIIAVSDVVEAMASHRSYRNDFSIDEALAEIERGSGEIYDKEVASVCMRIFRENINKM